MEGGPALVPLGALIVLLDVMASAPVRQQANPATNVFLENGAQEEPHHVRTALLAVGSLYQASLFAMHVLLESLAVHKTMVASHVHQVLGVLEGKNLARSAQLVGTIFTIQAMWRALATCAWQAHGALWAPARVPLVRRVDGVPPKGHPVLAPAGHAHWGVTASMLGLLI